MRIPRRVSSFDKMFTFISNNHKFYRKTMATFLFWFTDDSIPAWLLLVSVMYLCGCLLCQFVVSAVIMCRVTYEFVMVSKSCQSELDQEWRVILYKCGSINTIHCFTLLNLLWRLMELGAIPRWSAVSLDCLFTSELLLGFFIRE